VPWAAHEQRLDAEVFQRFMAVMLPDDGHVMTIVESYFDESGSHDGAKVLCVAGYIFAKPQAELLDQDWREVLAWKGLPYFHMVDCAHGNGVFANLTKKERIMVASRMIGIIKKRAVQGVAVTILPEKFSSIIGTGHPVYTDAYVVLAHAMVQAMVKFLGAQPPGIERMAYFFEAGHKSRPNAEALMHVLFNAPSLKDQYQYGGHAFVPKEKTPCVQAADFLAWQWCKERKNLLEGRPTRKDCASLLCHPHTVSHVTDEILQTLADLREPFINAISKMRGEQPS
jgi:hypothetical protein